MSILYLSRSSARALRMTATTIHRSLLNFLKPPGFARHLRGDFAQSLGE